MQTYQDQANLVPHLLQLHGQLNSSEATIGLPTNEVWPLRLSGQDVAHMYGSHLFDWLVCLVQHHYGLMAPPVSGAQKVRREGTLSATVPNNRCNMNLIQKKFGAGSAQTAWTHVIDMQATRTSASFRRQSMRPAHLRCLGL